ncbi:tryptophan-rich sensory protein [bacterium]|nr:tryptophan-rich sensory protein [bacterium]
MNLQWYNTLNKPFLTPPAKIFMPAWMVLYILIFTSLLLYMNAKTTENKTLGYIAFIIQLILNFSWSPVFFQFQNIGLSFIIILLLTISIIVTIIYFSRVSKISAILLIPYLLWAIFAMYLNYGIMKLN